MRVTKINLYHVRLPMTFQFKTAKGSLSERDTIIIRVENAQGQTGYGEVVSFQTPFYTAETFDQSWQALSQDYLPKVINCDLIHPFDCHHLFENPLPMATAGLENALLDLYFKTKNQNLITGLFQEELASRIPRGAVLGQMSLQELKDKTENLIKQAVTRIKVKISPQTPLGWIRELVQSYPDISFALDANQSFSLEDWPQILALDDLNLLFIEEPFAIKKLTDLKNLMGHLPTLPDTKLRLKTPICFDESIQNLDDLAILPEFPITPLLNIKISRLGGLYYTQKAIDFCRNHGIGFWIGSMVESGISKILHVQLAALSGNSNAGDLSDSKHYFYEDLILPEIAFPEGWLTVPKAIGLGVEVNTEALKRHTIRKEVFQ